MRSGVLVAQLRKLALDLASGLDVLEVEFASEHHLLTKVTEQLQELLLTVDAAVERQLGAREELVREAPPPTAAPASDEATNDLPTPSGEAGPTESAPVVDPREGQRCGAQPGDGPGTPGFVRPPRHTASTPAAPSRPAFRRSASGRPRGSEKVWNYLEAHPGEVLSASAIARGARVSMSSADNACRSFYRRGFVSGGPGGWRLGASAPPAALEQCIAIIAAGGRCSVSAAPGAEPYCRQHAAKAVNDSSPAPASNTPPPQGQAADAPGREEEGRGEDKAGGGASPPHVPPPAAASTGIGRLLAAIVAEPGRIFQTVELSEVYGGTPPGLRVRLGQLADKGKIERLGNGRWRALTSTATAVGGAATGGRSRVQSPSGGAAASPVAQPDRAPSAAPPDPVDLDGEDDAPPPHLRPGAALRPQPAPEPLPPKSGPSAADLASIEAEEPEDEDEDDEALAPKPRGMRTSSRPPTRQEQRDNELRLRAGRPLVPEGTNGPPIRELRTKVPINKTESRW